MSAGTAGGEWSARGQRRRRSCTGHVGFGTGSRGARGTVKDAIERASADRREEVSALRRPAHLVAFFTMRLPHYLLDGGGLDERTRDRFAVPILFPVNWDATGVARM